MLLRFEEERNSVFAKSLLGITMQDGGKRERSNDSYM